MTNEYKDILYEVRDGVVRGPSLGATIDRVK